MSKAGRDECQTFPVATLNNNDGRSKVAMANPRLLQTLFPWTMRRRSDHDPCPAASIKAPILMCRCHAQNEERADSWADTTTPQGRLMLTVLGALLSLI